MNPKSLFLASLLCSLGLSQASAIASCDMIKEASAKLNAIKTLSQEEAQNTYLERFCGSENMSWIGGAAGRRRFEYMNCIARARQTFRKKWASWQADLDAQSASLRQRQRELCINNKETQRK